ncbi:hypothetical protein ACUN0C_18010 [Faunimonas sp. B44]|uniref:hypothetical protein n=1 Tax=Faunimonas sp. B44 TaxID=3461493 RepID=UPI0040451410
MTPRALALAALGYAAWTAPGAAQGFGIHVGPVPPLAVYDAPAAVYGPPIVAYPAPVPEMPAVVPAEEVRRALMRAGYSDVGPVRTSGGFYEVEAFDPNGILLALRLSAFSGEIVAYAPVRADLPLAAAPRPVGPDVQMVAPPAAIPAPRPAAEAMPVQPDTPDGGNPLVVY